MKLKNALLFILGISIWLWAAYKVITEYPAPPAPPKQVTCVVDLHQENEWHEWHGVIK